MSSYATAKDELEIASEETDKKSVYAEDDRKAAREEFERLKGRYEEVVRSGSGDGEEGGGEEVRRRVGQRVRELEGAVEGLEEKGREE